MDDSPPPVPMWGKKPPPAEEPVDVVVDDSPPPKPLWGQKKPPAEQPMDVADDAGPPKPLWGQKKKPVTFEPKEEDDEVGELPKPKGRANRGSVFARNAVAKALGRRKAQSVYSDKAGEEGTVILKTDDHEYELGNVLGTGAYATVRVCKDPVNGTVFAVKVFKKSFLKRRRFSSGEWKTNLDGVHREIAIMKQIHHPHVMALHDVTASDNHLYMVMDFCPRGAIMETDQLPRPPLPLNDSRRWFADAVLGLQYLHFQGVVHHDLKPDNILVNMKGAAVISDFGVSRAHGGTSDQDVDMPVTPGGRDSKGNASLAKGASGTPLYNAPEKFNSSTYDGTAADVWALGVTLHAMVFGKLPYPAEKFGMPEDLEEAICAAGEFEIECECDDESLATLIQGMMKKAPAERLTLDEVHDAKWANQLIKAEEEFGGGGPRSSWTKIAVTDKECKAAVAKGQKLTRTAGDGSSVAEGGLPTVPEGGKARQSPKRTRRSTISEVVFTGGGCFGRGRKMKKAKKKQQYEDATE